MDQVVAHIHPDHLASGQVAARAGLRPTPERVDGEQVWRLPAPPGILATLAVALSA